VAKKSHKTIMLVNEEFPNTGTKYIKNVPTKGLKSRTKLRLKKYDPVVKKHCFFVQKNLPSHSK